VGEGRSEVYIFVTAVFPHLVLTEREADDEGGSEILLSRRGTASTNTTPTLVDFFSFLFSCANLFIRIPIANVLTESQPEYSLTFYECVGCLSSLETAAGP